jgi:vacuolar iron transporter family protein
MSATKSNHEPPVHFKGKDALGHVVEAQAQGLISASEVHGTEIPGYLSAAADAARETAIILGSVWLLLFSLDIARGKIISLLTILTIGWLFWKLGRGAWLGWFRLERLHRVLEQERWEIEHHRQQERDELRILYAAKGFEGKLLEDVLDVLMADNDRLLKVMIQEELGLSLASTEHPLKQGIGAAAGVFVSTAACLLSFLGWPQWGMFAGVFGIVALSSGITAHWAQNKVIPAIIWNLGLTALALGSIYFFLQTFHFL